MPRPGSDLPGGATASGVAEASAPSLADRLAGFDEHWRALRPELARIEAWRWFFVIVGSLMVAAGVPILGWGIGEFVGVVRSGYPWIIYVAAGSLLSSLGQWLARSPARRAGRLIRGKVIGCFGLGYRRDASSFPVDGFERNDLLPRHTKRELEDLVYGDVSGVPLIFCDATLSVKGLRRTERVEVFRGPLVLSRFPKRARGRTLVVPDGGAIGNFFVGIAGQHRQRVKLESPDFERAFAVWSTDQIEARYLLTPTMMERLLALKQRFPGDMTVAFDGHEFMLALDDGRDWFPDPGLLRSLTHPARVREQAEEIARIAEIVEILKLNLDTRA
ncbi:5-methyltetrahydropteroyltriglutamate--homocysteine methyltransferase [alpha proteobacterium BAL199]|jgi:hypothetical protein|nr:5-methyltetrahydropteroyltriglutamate--homocysteine methyltransferase [alpha proteobacterium BAL199]